MTRDIYLIMRFSKIRLPVWVTCFPILGNFVFYNIYKSWMIAYSDPDFFWKQYLKVQFRTGGVIVCSILGLLLFSGIYWGSFIASDAVHPFVVPLFFGIFLFVILFNIVYQPINLHFEPKRVLKDYKINDLVLNQDAWNDELAPYNFENCLNNLRRNFDKLSCFTLFSADLTLREQWISNSGKILVSDAKAIPLSKRHRLRISLKEMTNVGGTTVSLPTTIDEFNKACEKDELINNGLYESNILTQVAIRGFASGSCGHFSYLSAAGIWYIGVLSTIFSIFNVKNNFTKRLNYLGWTWTIFTFAISISFFTFIVVAEHTGLIVGAKGLGPAFAMIMIPPYLIVITLITHLFGVLVWSVINNKLSKVSFVQQATLIPISTSKR